MTVNKKIPLLEKDRLLLALRRLNMIVPNELPILSLYLTTDSSRENMRQTLEFIDSEMEKIYHKVEEQKLPLRTLRETIERIKEFIEFSTDEGAQGLAAFLSPYREIYLTYPIDFKFVNQIVYDKDAYRIPLIQLLAEQPREVFITLFPDTAALYRFSDDRLVEKEPPVFPQEKGQELEEYMRHVKDIYWPYFRSDDVRDVFLLGNKEAMIKFVGVLAKTAVQKVKEQVEVPRNAAQRRLEKEAQKLIQQYNIIDPERKVDHAKQLAQRKLAVFGEKAVFSALREGKVKEILVEPSFTPSGWRCARCGLLGVDETDNCTFCRGETQEIKHIKDALIRDSRNFEAQVTRVSHPYLREEGNGIAAILRFF